MHQKKQIKYALSYFSYHDPIQAFVDAGYVSTIYEAKASKNYTKPLLSKGVQLLFSFYKKSFSTSLLSLKIKKKELFIKSFKNYRNKSELGTNAQELLIDIINNPYNSTKERLIALEMLMKYFPKIKKNKLYRY